MTRSTMGYVSSETINLVTQSDTTPAVCSGGSQANPAGDTITVGNATYALHTFTGDGTLTVTTPGFIDVFLVSGGGGGGGNRGPNGPSSLSAGGGGAGGVLQTTMYVNANQAVVIGAGGVGGIADTSPPKSGSSSSIGGARGVSVAGGGSGADYSNAYNGQAQLLGGSGGGGFHSTTLASRTGAPSDRKSTRLNSSHVSESRMPSSA